MTSTTGQAATGQTPQAARGPSPAAGAPDDDHTRPGGPRHALTGGLDAVAVGQADGEHHDVGSMLVHQPQDILRPAAVAYPPPPLGGGRPGPPAPPPPP